MYSVSQICKELSILLVLASLTSSLSTRQKKKKENEKRNRLQSLPHLHGVGLIFLDPQGGPESACSVRVYSVGGKLVFVREMRESHAIIQFYVLKKSIYLSFCMKTFVLHRKTWVTQIHIADSVCI